VTKQVVARPLASSTCWQAAASCGDIRQNEHKQAGRQERTHGDERRWRATLKAVVARTLADSTCRQAAARCGDLQQKKTNRRRQTGRAMFEVRMAAGDAGKERTCCQTARCGDLRQSWNKQADKTGISRT
jgi:hypothetical protein